MKFERLPAVVDAHPWYRNGDHPEDDSLRDGSVFLSEGKVVRYFCRPDVPGDKVCEQCFRTMQLHGWIDTLEGGHTVCPGDWIITGVEGERYPCKPHIFVRLYKPV